MGKNNLFVIEEYGCVFSMCIVFIDVLIFVERYFLIDLKCMDCNVCVENCFVKVIYGNEWILFGKREFIIDVLKCFCVLRCMMSCLWLLRYVN